jgi:phasin family protein
MRADWPNLADRSTSIPSSFWSEHAACAAFIDRFYVEENMQPYATNPALRSQLETQVNFMTQLATRSCDSMRRLSELNMRLAQQMIEDSVSLSRQLLSCTDPFQMTSTAMQQMQPAAEHLRSYQQQVMGLLAGAQTDFARSAQSQMSEAGRSASAMADQMVRGAADSAANFGAAHNPT